MEDNNLDVAQTIREFSETEAALEVERILKAFKLNPWEQLGVDIDASTEEINKQYRKRSLLVHPDRCKHPQAKIAFQLLATAKKEIEEEGRKNVLKATVNDAKAMIIHQRKLKPGDPYLKTSAFELELRKQVNKILADIEWRKRQLERRMTEEEGRAKKEEEEKKELKRKKAEAEKNWEDQRDSRVAEWRNFLSKDKKRKTKRVKKESELSNSVAMKIAESKTTLPA
jgi:DnaJ family protein C protein 8